MSSPCSNVNISFHCYNPSSGLYIIWIGNNCKFKLCDEAVVAVGRENSPNMENRSVESLSAHGSLDPDTVSVPPSCMFEGYIFEPQSGSMTAQDVNIGVTPSEHKEENIKFNDQIAPYSVDIHKASDPTRRLQDSGDATLENFFSRPIKIHEEEWSTSTALAFDIDPWSLYFNNKRVVNRIANYKLMRANLHVKVVINGNGFQYGRAIVSYLPLDQFDGMSTNAALVPQDLIQASQYPHIFLDPTTSTGGDMTLPFFYFLNYVDVPTAGWDNLGEMYFRSLNDLKHANGAADKATISVFAWATDVSTNVLTSQNPSTMVPQSGSEIDEANAKGAISGPATTIAKVSNALAVIPAIAPFAMATSTVASAVGAAAKSLGFCRPPVTKNPDPIRNHPCSHLAATNVPDTALKLTVDDKQELSIDPRIAGLGPEDPMSIKEIAKRESYLTKFTWRVGDPPETLLWNSRICPVTWDVSGISPVAYHFPACAFAALPFKYWTGTMNFRFQVVASSFHKGRIRVIYDPDYISGDEYNVNYSEVIDLADKSDFTISIGNGQNYTLLDNPLPAISPKPYQPTPFVTKGVGNGIVALKILNELTVPNSTINNDVEVNVYVSMGEDFEVFVPDDYFSTFVFKPQSGLETSETIVTEAQNTEEPNKPLHEESSTIGPGTQDLSLVNKVYTGESIMSFRQLLKRYSLWRRESVWPSDGVKTPSNIEWYGSRNMFPFLRGNVTGAIETDSLANPYNYCNTLLLHWIAYAHQGWRGGIRYKMIFKNAPDSGSGVYSANGRTQSMYVERADRGDVQSGYGQVVNTDPGYTKETQGAYDGVYGLIGKANSRKLVSGPKGSLYQDSSINPVAEFEVPYYSNYRFSPGKSVDLTTAAGVQQDGFNWYCQTYADQNFTTDFHCAAAEDFQVYFFTGLPRMYHELNAPLP